MYIFSHTDTCVIFILRQKFLNDINSIPSHAVFFLINAHKTMLYTWTHWLSMMTSRYKVYSCMQYLHKIIQPMNAICISKTWTYYHHHLFKHILTTANNNNNGIHYKWWTSNICGTKKNIPQFEERNRSLSQSPKRIKWRWTEERERRWSTVSAYAIGRSAIELFVRSVKNGTDCRRFLYEKNFKRLKTIIRNVNDMMYKNQQWRAEKTPPNILEN